MEKHNNSLLKYINKENNKNGFVLGTPGKSIIVDVKKQKKYMD